MTIKEQLAEARDAADRLFEYAGFSFAADHLDMAIDATREAFARFERETLERAAQAVEQAGHPALAVEIRLLADRK